MNNVIHVCALCIVIWTFPVRAQTDLTRVDNSYGPLVVDTTIKLLRDACLIKDHLLLERIASFETNDGLDIISGDHGGIWKVMNLHHIHWVYTSYCHTGFEQVSNTGLSSYGSALSFIAQMT